MALINVGEYHQLNIYGIIDLMWDLQIVDQGNKGTNEEFMSYRYPGCIMMAQKLLLE